MEQNASCAWGNKYVPIYVDSVRIDMCYSADGQYMCSVIVFEFFRI